MLRTAPDLRRRSGESEKFHADRDEHIVQDGRALCGERLLAFASPPTRDTLICVHCLREADDETLELLE